MSDLQGKKILFFSPKFFNYEKEICKEIEQQGGIVHFYDERNNPNTIEKILLRKFRFLLSWKINEYYKKISLDEGNFSPDYIFFNNPEALNKKSLILLKNKFLNSKFILYMWDSIKNKRNVKKIYPLFDKCFSFDQLDCKKYGFNFRPLFYINEFNNEKTNINFDYDFSFIGTIHSDRALILNQLYQFCLDNNYRIFLYLYFPSKLLYLYGKIKDSNIRKLDKAGFIHFTPIDKCKIQSISDKTKYIIDINHPKQVGLTMRTIEMLGLNKKILTTNKYIKDYDFYNPKNIIIINRKNIDFKHNINAQNYELVSEKIKNKYSLSSWINEVLVN